MRRNTTSDMTGQRLHWTYFKSVALLESFFRNSSTRKYHSTFVSSMNPSIPVICETKKSRIVDFGQKWCNYMCDNSETISESPIGGSKCVRETIKEIKTKNFILMTMLLELMSKFWMESFWPGVSKAFQDACLCQCDLMIAEEMHESLVTSSSYPFHIHFSSQTEPRRPSLSPGLPTSESRCY
jgi:hypothetical protein